MMPLASGDVSGFFCVGLLVEFETRSGCVVFGSEALNRIAEREGGRWLG